MIEINGMAHVVLTVSRFDEARAFYCELLPFLGMHKVFDGNHFVYHVGGRTALGIQRAAPEHEGERFVQNRVGLHHLCLRARSREDVDKAAAKLRAMGAVNRPRADGAGVGARLLLRGLRGSRWNSPWRLTTFRARACLPARPRLRPATTRTGARTRSSCQYGDRDADR